MAAEHSAVKSSAAVPSPQAAGSGPRPSSPEADAIFSLEAAEKLPTEMIKLRSKIGAGTFSSVYADRGFRVAAKVMHDPLWFLLEAFALKKLERSKYVVPMLGTNTKHTAILMPCATTTLWGTARRTREQPLNPMLLKAWAWQLLSGVADAHDRGVLHRDIKPSNVLVSRTGSLWIADWNSATFLTNADGTQGQNLERYGLHADTCTAMTRPPETFGESPESHLAKGDVWSAAVTLAFLAMGRHSLDFFWTSSAEIASQSEAVVMAKIAVSLGVPETYDFQDGHLRYMADDIRRKNLISLIGRSKDELPTKFVDLLLLMLNVNSDERPTAAQCLDHEYFAGMNDNVSIHAAMLNKPASCDRDPTVLLSRARNIRILPTRSLRVMADLGPVSTARFRDDWLRKVHVLREAKDKLKIDDTDAETIADILSIILPGLHSVNMEEDEERSKTRFVTKFFEWHGFHLPEALVAVEGIP